MCSYLVDPVLKADSIQLCEKLSTVVHPSFPLPLACRAHGACTTIRQCIFFNAECCCWHAQFHYLVNSVLVGIRNHSLLKRELRDNNNSDKIKYFTTQFFGRVFQSFANIIQFLELVSHDSGYVDLIDPYIEFFFSKYKSFLLEKLLVREKTGLDFLLTIFLLGIMTNKYNTPDAF